jgi:CRP-like cAMP-binding protein
MPDLAVEERLKTVPLFQGLRPGELQAVASASVERKVESERFLFQQGDPAERIYLLLEGKLRLSQLTPEGQQVILHYVSPGEAFGVIAVLSGSEYPVTAQAVEPCTVRSWSQAAMRGLMEQNPTISLNAIRILAERVQEFQDRLRELATERVERRVARAVIRLARQAGRKTPEGVLIDMPLSRQDLAEMTGTTLYTVSRIFSQWESRGLVQSKREQVLIRLPHGLVSIAEDLPSSPGTDE